MDKRKIEAFVLNNNHGFAIKDIPIIQKCMEAIDDSIVI